jgi:hypothetical protein
MHESLTIAIVAPLLDRVPWSIHATKLAGDLRRTCQGCRIPIVAGRGLGCGNFGVKRLHWEACQGAWHGNCYRQKEADWFPIQSTREQEEVDFEEEEGTERKKTVFEWDAMEITCCFRSSAIYVSFRTFSNDFQAAIRETSSLRFAYFGCLVLMISRFFLLICDQLLHDS